MIHGHVGVHLPPYLPLASALRDAGWTEAYEDKSQVLFVRPGYEPSSP